MSFFSRWLSRASPVSKRPPTYRLRPAFDRLEDRLAPATRISTTVLTFTDTDAESVRVTFSKPILTSDAVANSIFAFSSGPGGVNGSNTSAQQLWGIDLSSAAGARGTAITVELDGGASVSHISVGFLNAAGVDLGKVTINGDLGRIVAGDSTLDTPAVKKLNVISLGVRGIGAQAPGGNLVSNFNGPVGKLVVQENVLDARIGVSGDALGDIGLVRIGGSFSRDTGDAVITARGSIEEVRIGGSINGGIIFALESIGDITIGGNLSTRLGERGNIGTDGGIGAITIGGSILGGASGGSATILADGGRIESLFVGGSILGGTGTASGFVFATGGVGSLTINGDLRGGLGENSGMVRCPVGGIGDIHIGGSVVGGDGTFSGAVYAAKKIGDITILQHLDGGAGNISAVFSTNGNIGDVTIGGDMTGGAGLVSGRISASGNIGAVSIGGRLAGGAGELSGGIDASVNIGDVAILGAFTSGRGSRSGSITAGVNLGNVFAGGGIEGHSAVRVVIAAGTYPGLGSARLGNIDVNGGVSFADILCGYSVQPAGGYARSIADARIGHVLVRLDWIASNLAAGVDMGADSLFGTADDGTAVGGSSAFTSKIGAITIDGALSGTEGEGDHFGIVAEQVKSLSINGGALALLPGPQNDQSIAFFPYLDVSLNELEA